MRLVSVRYRWSITRPRARPTWSCLPSHDRGSRCEQRFRVQRVVPLPHNLPHTVPRQNENEFREGILVSRRTHRGVGVRAGAQAEGLWRRRRPDRVGCRVDGGRPVGSVTTGVACASPRKCRRRATPSISVSSAPRFSRLRTGEARRRWAGSTRQSARLVR